MIRRFQFSVLSATEVRCLSVAAPLLHFPVNTVNKTTSLQDQIAKNTTIAIDMMQRFKGKPPQSYKRKYKISITELKNEIESILGGATELRHNLADDQPMDKLTLIERCLRHALWSYYKEEGDLNVEEMSKWIIYTAEDEMRLAQLKRQIEMNKRLSAFRSKQKDKECINIPKPKIDWNKEYTSSVDRELVEEKRIRYDLLSSKTIDCDQKQLEAFKSTYKKPIQDKRLDDLVELLERFKPVLAREAIMQRLTIKHLEGQLGVWRYMDWCPEVRDRAEVEIDNQFWPWWAIMEERRLLPIRLRSVNEVREIMSKVQSEKAEEKAEHEISPVRGVGDADKERLLKEVLALQARIHQRDESAEVGDKAKTHEKEIEGEENYKVKINLELLTLQKKQIENQTQANTQ